MSQERADRIAENEASFRRLNQELGVMGVFVCECGDADCREHVQMERERYEAVRANSRHFFVRPGHQIEDTETVVTREDGFYVVEKPDDVAHIVDER